MGTVLLFVHPDVWVGGWQALAGYLRGSLILTVPLCAAVAAWQGGRERRRGTVELLAATPRPSWHPLLVTWATLVVAAAGGLLLTFTVGAAFVAPRATYSGGGWWWLALGCLPPVATAVALGLAVGRGVPLRVAGLLLAVALYVIQGFPLYLHDASVMWLDPVIDRAAAEDSLGLGTHGWQALWFGGLCLAVLAVAAWGSVPVVTRTATPLTAGAGLVLACLGAVPLLAGPGDGRWVADPGARQEVCASGTPRVCVMAVDAYLLPDVVPAARRVLHRLSGVPGAPTRAITAPRRDPWPADALVLSDLTPTLRGGLDRRWGDPVAQAARSSVLSRACYDGTEPPGFEQRIVIEEIAGHWILQQDPEPPQHPPGAVVVNGPYTERVEAGFAGLQHLPLPQQRTWIGRVYATRDRCDAATQKALLGVVVRG